MNADDAALTWYPVHVLGRRYQHVPNPVADAASEAHSCRNIGARRAAVLMARSVIEATAKEKGIKNGKLADKIDEMYQKKLIRELVKDQAHEIRYLGNDMAHGDFAAPITVAEADEILELMDQVLEEVYVAPAKLDARKQARLAQKPAGSSS